VVKILQNFATKKSVLATASINKNIRRLSRLMSEAEELVVVLLLT
jgi:hypothetical protein